LCKYAILSCSWSRKRIKGQISDLRSYLINSPKNSSIDSAWKWRNINSFRFYGHRLWSRSFVSSSQLCSRRPPWILIQNQMRPNSHYYTCKVRRWQICSWSNNWCHFSNEINIHSQTFRCYGFSKTRVYLSELNSSKLESRIRSR